MPRGIPNAGVRRPRGTYKAEQAVKAAEREKIRAAVQSITQPKARARKAETDEQILTRINRQFSTLKTMTTAVCDGKSRALVVSGPPGLGKSFEIEKIVADKKDFDIAKTAIRQNEKAAEEAVDKKSSVSEEDEEDQDDVLDDVLPDLLLDTNSCAFIKGFIRPTGLYQTLYRHRHKGHVVVFDDLDSIFDTIDSLNLLKAACDTTERRFISWGSLTKMEDDFGERLPTTFEFEGSIIFITNVDFLHEIENGSKRSPHLKALISRAHYIDMEIKTIRDYIVRIKQVVEDEHMIEARLGGNKAVQKEILEYVEKHADEFRELDLRSVLKMTDLYNINPKAWRSMTQTTLFKV